MNYEKPVRVRTGGLNYRSTALEARKAVKTGAGRLVSALIFSQTAQWIALFDNTTTANGTGTLITQFQVAANSLTPITVEIPFRTGLVIANNTGDWELVGDSANVNNLRIVANFD